MNRNEKVLARKLFKLKIHEADGQNFEDIFTTIMNYAEPDFQSIKPWGNIGDRKNDGYIKSKGVYFQVFAPEEIEKSYPKVIEKLNTDFIGLTQHWSPINEFYFVVNDKYKGVNADCEQAIQKLKQDYQLQNAGFKTAKDLENILFSLDDDQIIVVIECFPDPANIQLDYSILSEIINHLTGLPLAKPTGNKFVYPDWDEKIVFNNLGELESRYLNNGSLQIGMLDEYLNNEGNFFADELKDKICEVYLKESQRLKSSELFWKMVEIISLKPESSYQSAAIVLMAKYFEVCDIFEEPK